MALPAAEMKQALGPFAGNPEGVLRLVREGRGRSFACLSGLNDEEILKAVRALKVASRSHLASLLGLSENGSKKTLERLFRLGYLDRLKIEHTPPLYVLGVEGRLLLGLKDEEWDVLRALRIAAANSFWVRFRQVRPDASWQVEPHLGLTAGFTLGKTFFGVLAPRLWPGEIDWCRKLAALVPESGRLVILAACRAQAEELSRVLSVACQVRFTWDRECLVFYRGFKGILEPAEDFSQRPIDGSAAGEYNQSSR